MSIDMQGLHFITRRTKFHRQINGGDQSIVNRMTQSVATKKKNHHTISDEMFSIATSLVTENISLPIILATQNIPSSIV
jgi:hypothetical protein